MTETVDKKTEEKIVTLTIDGAEVTVPEGMLLVDAAKKVGIDIPVFCYHPKMEPVGMCRVCMVDIGLPRRDRATGEIVKEDDGSPVIDFGRTLQTACTAVVAEGMVVEGASEKVQKARQDILEFLLTSHPLDCPICDKGGECPLQNLTMGFGPGESRFDFEEKKHGAKNVPLGDLIFLDRERCIQCARCTRFQSEIADDAVIGFENRGRSLQIVTYSDPGFDSYWSGNTSDICPVGALTTADFRFGARPWEMLASASICTQCAVNCNLTLNTRREAKSGGELVVKRAMPRQNEAVNELWICDKGRFGYHYSAREGRLPYPAVRKGESLRKASLKAALDAAATGFENAGKDVLILAGGRLSNEDYFNIKQLADAVKGKAVLYSEMAGGNLAAQAGLTPGSNFADLGAGDAVIVIASDLEEEAPLWWLRVKQAAERGADVIAANPRATKLDKKASFKLRYDYGQEAATALALAGEGAADKDVKDAAKVIADAKNLVVLYGSEGTSLASSEELANACTYLLTSTGHIGKPNNGLVPVWDKGNAQGAWDMGLRPSQDLAVDLRKAKMAYIVGADPAGDDPKLAKALEKAGMIVVQEIRKTDTTQMAHVLLPAQSFPERDGSYTSGERRVQRFYPAVPGAADTKPDFSLTAEIATRMRIPLELRLAGAVFEQIAEKIEGYAGLDYEALAEVTEQWPIVGREDLYYGGTSYKNEQGLGVTLPNTGAPEVKAFKPTKLAKEKGLTAVPVTTLLDRGNTLLASEVLLPRLAVPYVALSEEDAKSLDAGDGAEATAKVNGVKAEVVVRLDASLPKGVVLVPRSLGLPIYGPTAVEIKVK